MGLEHRLAKLFDALRIEGEMGRSGASWLPIKMPAIQLFSPLKPCRLEMPYDLGPSIRTTPTTWLTLPSNETMPGKRSQIARYPY